MVDEENNSWEEGEDFKIAFEKAYGLQPCGLGFFLDHVLERKEFSTK